MKKAHAGHDAKHAPFAHCTHKCEGENASLETGAPGTAKADPSRVRRISERFGMTTRQYVGESNLPLRRWRAAKTAPFAKNAKSAAPAKARKRQRTNARRRGGSGLAAKSGARRSGGGGTHPSHKARRVRHPEKLEVPSRSLALPGRTVTAWASGTGWCRRPSARRPFRP